MADLVRDVFLAFARVHILHHAAEERIFGVGMMKELARHGYRLGPGTLYPLLHRLKEDGLLLSETTVVDGKTRKYYVITRKGHLALNRIRPKLSELVREAIPEAMAAPDPRRGKTNWCV
jgi:PadR family transcriptional regulator, regulatory protein PadR